MHPYPAYSLPAEGKEADSILPGPRLWSISFLTLFALAACAEGKGATLTGTVPDPLCSSELTTGACRGFSGTGAEPDFTLRGGEVGGNVTGGDEDNIFMLLGGSVTGYVDAGDGDDEITLGGTNTWHSYDGGARGGGTTATKVWGGAGADMLILDGATIMNDITGDDEDETFMLMSGTVMRNVDGGDGDDEITIQDADVAGYLLWDSQDTIALTGSGSLAELRGTEENDVIVIDDGTNGIDLPSTFTLTNIDLRAGNDDLTLNGVTIAGYVSGGEGDDVIDLQTGTYTAYDGGTGTDSGMVYGGPGMDNLALQSSATISGNVMGEDSETDFLGLNGTVRGYVDALGGDDSITLGGTGTWHSYDGGVRPSSETEATKVWGGAGTDDFTLDGATIMNDVTGDDQAETFTLMSGTIMGNLKAGGGNDTILFHGDITMDTGYIDGGTGTDTLDYGGGGNRIFDAAATPVERTDPIVNDDRDLFRNIETCSGVIAATPTCMTDSTTRSGFVLRGFEVLAFSPQLALAGVLPSALQDFTSAAAGFLSAPQENSGLWIKEKETLSFGGGGMSLAASGLEGLEAEGVYGAKMSLTQQGYDKPLSRTGGLVLRSFMHLAEGEVEADAAGHADVQGYGAGMALLWRKGGVYMQAAALAAWYEADMRHEGEVSSTKGEGFLVSLDMGRAYVLTDGLALRPQARVLWQSLFLDDFSQDDRRFVFGADERLEARAGFAFDGAGLEATAFMVHTSGNTASLTTGLTQNYDLDGLAFELGLNAVLSDSLGVALTRRISLEGRRNDFAASLKLSHRF